MGHEKSSVDWLPAGWKVQVRVRTSGKKDKCYVDPSNEHNFFSKPQVLCYLKNIGINHPICEETENRRTSRRSTIKSTVKEAVAEGLPAGWIKETRVTQKGNKIRRDAYYIDPVSGHLFRSMKEVFSYLDTGETRRRASKPMEPVNLEMRKDSLSPLAETEEKMIADSKEEKQFTGSQSLKSETAVVDNDSLPEAMGLAQGSKKGISSGSSSPAAEVPPENLQEGNESEAAKSKRKKRNHKKLSDLPRRTSKRLAGIEVDLSMVLNLRPRVRRATSGRQTSEVEVGDADRRENLDNSDEHAKRMKTGDDEAVEKQEISDVLPPGDVTIPEEAAKQEVTELEGDEKKMEVSLDLPFSELWKDPCIEFAIKTLTGAIPIGEDDKVDGNTASSSSNVPVPADGVVPGSCCKDLPPKDFWADPCFEFAVKTLTGDLPIVNDITVEAITWRQQQQPSHNSSQALIGQNGMTKPSFRSVGFSNGAGVAYNRYPNVGEAAPPKQQL